MIRSTLASTLLALGVAFGGAVATPAAAQSQDAAIARAHAFEIYRKSETAILDFLDAQTDFNEADAVSDTNGMSIAAGDMLGASTEAAYWAVILDEIVQAQAVQDEPKAYSAELRTITTGAYREMIVLAPNRDFDGIRSLLDNSAEGLNGLRNTVSGIYDWLQRQYQ